MASCHRQPAGAERTTRPALRATSVFGFVGLMWISISSVLASELPRNAIVTPQGDFTENYSTPFQAQAVNVRVEFSNDRKTATATLGSGGNGGRGGMHSWVAVVGGKRQVFKANWRIEDTLRNGIDLIIACGRRPTSLRTVKSLKGLSGTLRTPDEQEKLAEAITTRASDRLCKVSLSFESYGNYSATYRFATVEH